jgi:hypothetical protein
VKNLAANTLQGKPPTMITLLKRFTMIFFRQRWTHHLPRRALLPLPPGSSVRS